MHPSWLKAVLGGRGVAGTWVISLRDQLWQSEKPRETSAASSQGKKLHLRVCSVLSSGQDSLASWSMYIWGGKLGLGIKKKNLRWAVWQRNPSLAVSPSSEPWIVWEGFLRARRPETIAGLRVCSRLHSLTKALFGRGSTGSSSDSYGEAGFHF